MLRDIFLYQQTLLGISNAIRNEKSFFSDEHNEEYTQVCRTSQEHQSYIYNSASTVSVSNHSCISLLFTKRQAFKKPHYL